MPPLSLLHLLPALFLLFTALLLLTSSMTTTIRRLLQRPRFQPTVFHPHPHGLPAQHLFSPPAHPIRYENPSTLTIDDRYEFLKHLGSGCEGSTAIYSDLHNAGAKVVIKQFLPGVRQNPLPAHLLPHFPGTGAEWPSEIPATLFFAHSHSRGFIAPVDYFWLGAPRPRLRKHPQWRLVTPFLSSGTLETLAALLRHRRLAPHELDLVYRVRFRDVLVALAEMHAAGYCHDDVKPDNIFVAPPGHRFLLGDLGNVREHEHDFHSAGGGGDFRRGDTARAVRSYLGFLRDATGDRAAFDAAFLAGREEWSAFYWRYKRTLATAEELLRADPFWNEARGDEAERVAFEAEIEEMREEQRRWRREDAQAKSPAADVRTEVVRTVTSGTFQREEKTVSRRVDGELACVKVSIVERLLTPWGSKPGCSQSSY